MRGFGVGWGLGGGERGGGLFLIGRVGIILLWFLSDIFLVWV